ncbi:hypothetical protein [Streptomyces sp. NPDC003006]
MRRIDLDQRFALIFVVASTLFTLTTQEDQVACFRAVARHLAPGGVFVVEARVSDWQPGQVQGTSVREVGDEHVRWSAMQHEPVTQTVRSQEVLTTPQGVTMLPLVTRYAWPSELDLMARLAGMRCQARYGTWQGSPFKGDSTRHLTLYTLHPSDDR